MKMNNNSYIGRMARIFLEETYIGIAIDSPCESVSLFYYCGSASHTCLFTAKEGRWLRNEFEF